MVGEVSCVRGVRQGEYLEVRLLKLKDSKGSNYSSNDVNRYLVAAMLTAYNVV